MNSAHVSLAAAAAFSAVASSSSADAAARQFLSAAADGDVTALLQVMAPDVVLHAADYVSRQHLQRHGQAGYSRGCPALPPDQYRAIINSLPEGACLLLAGPGLESKWLDGAAAARQLAARGWR